MQVTSQPLLAGWLVWLVSATLYGQNLVPNYSFEDYTSCPNGFGMQHNLDCHDWFNANSATCDYYNVCSGNMFSSIPDNYQGYQVPVTGDGYIGILAKFGPPPNGWLEYPEAQLLEPLIFGQGYRVGFKVSLGKRGCAVQFLGAHFSVGAIEQPSSGYIPVTPQIESNTGFLNDTLNWMLIEGCFVAQGGEDHITLGNFHSYQETLTEQCNAPFPTTSYYYIDSVSVVKTVLSGLDLDLGEDATACYEYTINPDAPDDVYYLWSDGSTGPELTVTTSGEYKLTIYDSQCRGAKDSIDVTITNQPPVSFHPDDTLICLNESITISLDPSAGDYTWNDGSTSPQYTISTAGQYMVTLDDGCDLTTDEITVDVLNPPTPFWLGNDTILCPGTEIEFNFDPALGDFLWQDGNTASAVIIFQEGTYALTISNMCGAETASVLVDELVPMNVNLGPDQYVLCDHETLDISLDPTYATFEWQDGSTESEYQISTSGLYTVTMTHICGESSDSILILQLEVPEVELGDTIMACPGDTVLLTVSDINSEYTWQNGSSEDSIWVTTPALYAVTIENPCGMDQDSVLVQFEPFLLPVDLGADVSLCPGQSLILTGGNPGASHVWQDGSTADTFFVTGAGAYHVSVSNSCFVYSDTILVEIGNNPPLIDLPPQLVLCEGASVTLDPGLSGVAYLWNDGSTGSSLVISSADTYSVTVSNGCGSDVDSIEVINGGAPPSVLLGSDISVCPGDTVWVQPSFQHVDTWIWQDGSADTLYPMAVEGEVSIQVSNACGADADTIIASLLAPAPVLELMTDTSLCSGESVTLVISNEDVAILWNDGSTDSTLLVQAPGLYFATISNACGADSDTFQLSLLPPVPELDLGPDLPLCPGETIVIDPGIMDVTYLWQDGSTDPTYLVNSAQTISLTISHVCGTSSDTLALYSSTEGPDVNLGADMLACEGDSVLIDALILGVSYEWQDGSTDASLIVTQSGVYSVTVSNSCGTDMDTVVVDIHGLPPSLNLGPDTVLCEGESLTLVSAADAETIITWQDGSGFLTFVVEIPGLYSIHAVNRCGEHNDSIIVGYQSFPVMFDLGADTILCPGEHITLTGPVTSDEYVWQDGSHAPSLLAQQPGVYVLSISNECGMTSDSLLIQYDERIPIFLSPSPEVLCPGDSVTLDASQAFPVTYEWSTASEASSISVLTPGVYSVTVNTECSEWPHDYSVELAPDCDGSKDIFIPNVFSPNGDQINDEFMVFPAVNLEIMTITGTIFDRWGNLLFQSSAIPFIWDGRFGQRELPPGVYAYMIVIEYQEGSNVVRKRLKGDVTIVK